jgi:hypothetical protein
MPATSSTTSPNSAATFVIVQRDGFVMVVLLSSELTVSGPEQNGPLHVVPGGRIRSFAEAGTAFCRRT